MLGHTCYNLPSKFFFESNLLKFSEALKYLSLIFIYFTKPVDVIEISVGSERRSIFPDTGIFLFDLLLTVFLEERRHQHNFFGIFIATRKNLRVSWRKKISTFLLRAHNQI